jgi:cytochrome oxidase Cu insertion factor (SCO1/SenC/PrrC family)
MTWEGFTLVKVVKPSPGLWMMILVVLLVTLAGCLAPSEQSTPVPAADLPVAPVPGARAPDLQLTDLHGNEVSLSDLQGRPVLLNFWTTW